MNFICISQKKYYLKKVNYLSFLNTKGKGKVVKDLVIIILNCHKIERTPLWQVGDFTS